MNTYPKMRGGQGILQSNKEIQYVQMGKRENGEKKLWQKNWKRVRATYHELSKLNNIFCNV